ncbi:MAG: cob(I)yrinic acid a,c-diamide adenosyltransferase [Desulfocapsaceae bacterium]|nr:cob(I)yrinic acid a,c-diamide adenosyltransferase [Desulfocapsaceae bacterium]
MKIYTGTGDEGKTSLFSGERLPKSSLRVATYGEADELCSAVGVVVTMVPSCKEEKKLTADLQCIQADLFDLGAVLATSPGSPEADLLKPFSAEKIKWLEDHIDEMQKVLPELHSFILPGGHPSSAWAQMIRAICRRVERAVIALDEKEGCLHGKMVVTYLNRLSDYFFVLARYLNHLSGTAEITWHG